MFTGALNYSDPETQAAIEDVMQRLENSTFIDPAYSESWLRDFLDFVERHQDYSPIDISDERKFITELTQVRTHLAGTK